MSSARQVTPVRRHWIVVGALLAVAFVASACGGDGTTTDAADAEQGGESSTWLFSVIGPSADVRAGDPAGDGQQLVLNEPGDVIAFTDRPERRAVRLSAANLRADWNELFASSPPNAVLTGIAPDGSQFETAVELTTLVTGEEDALTFSFTTIGEDDGVGVPERLTEVALFIDDVDCPASVCLVYASTFIPFDSSF